MARCGAGWLMVACFVVACDSPGSKTVVDARWTPGPEPCPFPDWVRGPVRPDTTCVPGLLADSGAHWGHESGAHIAMHFTDGSAAATDPASFLARAEHAYADNLALLQLAPDTGRVDLFYVATKGENSRLTGGVGTGWTVAQARAIILVSPRGDRDPADRHELMHVVSMTRWGMNALADYWIREGLATYAGELCTPTNVDSIARAMLSDGRAQPLAEYRKAFFVPGRDNLAAYMLSASFVKFLIERDGIDRLKKLWQGGSETLAQVYAATPEQLETEWKASVTRRSNQGVAAAGVRGGIGGCALNVH